MELKQIQHFLAVVETGSFHAAAERVNLTQQAVSRSIKTLEQELGVTLLARRERDRRRVSPTPFGEMLLPRAQAIMAEVRVFRSELENLMGSGHGLVRLGATPIALRCLLPEAIAVFHQRKPGTRIQVLRHSAREIYGKLASGLYDLGICEESEQILEPIFRTDTLFTERNAFVARAGHPLASRKRIRLVELAGQQWVSVAPHSRSRYELNDMHTAQNLELPMQTIETSSQELALRFLMDTDNISFLPRHRFDAELAAGQLIELDVDSKSTARWPVQMVRRKDSPLSPLMQEFVETLTEVGRRIDKDGAGMVKTRASA